MKQKRFRRKRAAAGLALAVCLAAGCMSLLPAQAEELAESAEETLQEESLKSEDSGLTGTYTVADGWSEKEQTGEQTDDTGVWIYCQDSGSEETDTSTITCSYMDTGYSVLEYEQLREMLTNNLLYNNVNAQISTSAVYTLAKDYLYIVLVDDSAEAYRDIYYYVVGDYRCFCVQVREYRAEAQQMEAEEKKTPQEAGKSMAEGFTWNAF